MSPATVVSSSGKVLLAGGYLVLDPAYPGVVVSTSSRFYSVVHTLPETAARPDTLLIRVRSPQFTEATWVYLVELQSQNGVRVEQVADK